MSRVTDEGVQNARPPVLLGCVSAVAFVVAVFGFFAFLIVFLESGADSGKVQLEDAEAYAPGSVEFVGEENLFLVRLANVSTALSVLMRRTGRGRRPVPGGAGATQRRAPAGHPGALRFADGRGQRVSTLVFGRSATGVVRRDGPAAGRESETWTVPGSIDETGRVCGT